MWLKGSLAGAVGVIRNVSPNDACHWSSKLTWGDGGTLKAEELGGKADMREGRDANRNDKRCWERCCYFHPLCSPRCSACHVPTPALLNLFLNTRCSHCDKYDSQLCWTMDVFLLQSNSSTASHSTEVFVFAQQRTAAYYCLLAAEENLWNCCLPSLLSTRLVFLYISCSPFFSLFYAHHFLLSLFILPLIMWDRAFTFIQTRSFFSVIYRKPDWVWERKKCTEQS